MRAERAPPRGLNVAQEAHRACLQARGARARSGTPARPVVVGLGRRASVDGRSRTQRECVTRVGDERRPPPTRFAAPESRRRGTRAVGRGAGRGTAVGRGLSARRYRPGPVVHARAEVADPGTRSLLPVRAELRECGTKRSLRQSAAKEEKSGLLRPHSRHVEVTAARPCGPCGTVRGAFHVSVSYVSYAGTCARRRGSALPPHPRTPASPWPAHPARIACYPLSSHTPRGRLDALVARPVRLRRVADLCWDGQSHTSRPSHAWRKAVAAAAAAAAAAEAAA